tara:strand:+ start:434 stop:721 length:288 start_codon:yes stop_codon:yes gene_type:complete
MHKQLKTNLLDKTMLYIKFFETGLIESYTETPRECDVILSKFAINDPTSEPKDFRGKEDYYEKWEEDGIIIGIKKRSDEEIAALENNKTLNLQHD